MKKEIEIDGTPAIRRLYFRRVYHPTISRQAIARAILFGHIETTNVGGIQYVLLNEKTLAYKPTKDKRRILKLTLTD